MTAFVNGEMFLRYILSEEHLIVSLVIMALPGMYNGKFVRAALFMFIVSVSKNFVCINLCHEQYCNYVDTPLC